MIPMTMIGKVRRMFHRQNKSVREIARLTSLSRNTISKYLNAEVQEEPRYQRRSKPTRLTPVSEGAGAGAWCGRAATEETERRTGFVKLPGLDQIGLRGLILIT
jgi:transcriptional regulator with XRE-family HTH domain